MGFTDLPGAVVRSRLSKSGRPDSNRRPPEPHSGLGEGQWQQFASFSRGWPKGEDGEYIYRERLRTAVESWIERCNLGGAVPGDAVTIQCGSGDVAAGSFTGCGTC